MKDVVESSQDCPGDSRLHHDQVIAVRPYYDVLVTLPRSKIQCSRAKCVLEIPICAVITRRSCRDPCPGESR
jgi:hypothetical protein